MKEFLRIILIFIIVYLSICFIILEMNPLLWDIKVRITMLIIYAWVTLVVTLYNCIDEDELQ